ncbi:hypothetical protein GPECTOR_89g513 [Gonium pectorale]|uniref:Protein kinase domain-containing protein n=1 Tax=Gonium pectorale TaxID=33097 RepID=A0A150G0T2_GONPE|nr:hypothetical protein GPECTOR_89g513 [Gonium pectorale]|eukprot:KXZ43493.1 hypothetical protein GPECTOR_89g513 [Gonium pectorale]
MDLTRKARAKRSVLVGCRAALLLAVICFASLTAGQRSEVISVSSLPESLAAGGAVQAGPGGSARTGSAILPAGTYQPLDVQSVEVVGRLVVAGSGPGEGDGGEAAAGGGTTAATTLDLTAFQDGPAFMMLAGSSLELYNLTLLLPPAPPEALTAQPPTVLSHVIGGSPARVTLSGVRLVLPTQTNAASTSTSLPPPALLLRTRVICCGEAGPQPPFAYGAAAVRDATGLRAAAAELLAEMAPAPGRVLVWLAANVTLDPYTWGGPLEVPPGVYLMLFGNPDPGAATQLDFGGIASAIDTQRGFVQIQDLVLLGLPYPSTVGDLRAALAAWVHSVGVPRVLTGVLGAPPPVVRLSIIRCMLVLPAAEAAWWRAAIAAEAAAPGGAGPYLQESWRVSVVVGAEGSSRLSLRDSNSFPVKVLDNCTVSSLEESGAAASPRAVAVTAAWPLLQAFDDPAQIRLSTFWLLIHDESSETSLEGKADTKGATGNGTLVLANDALGMFGEQSNKPCALMGWPVSQTGRRTMWDMRVGSSDPPPLRLRRVTLVVLPAELALLRGLLEEAGALPPELTPSPPPPPGSEARFSKRAGSEENASVDSPAGQARAPGPLLAASHPLAGLLRTALEVAGDQTVRLLQPIGSGSYGTVYLGLWRGLPVAAKILVVHDTLLGPEGRRRQRAILEAAIGTTLEHPNVVATYAFDVKPLGVQLSGSEEPSEKAEPLWRQMGTQQSLQRNGGVATARNSSLAKADSDGKADASAATPSSDVYQLYILQELCSGGSIKEALEPMRALSGGLRAGASSAAASLHLAFQVACGLRHVHAAGIVHGDISSGNVLLARQAAPAPDGDAGDLDEAEQSWRSRLTRPGVPPPPPVVAKVADFGLSLRLTGSRTHASGLFQGTLVYMAPEVVANGRVGPASDVFSFGVLLLELMMGMCTGALLEAAATAPLVAAELRNPAHAHPLLAVLRVLLPPGSPHCPPELSRLAASCVAPVPGQRPTMEQIAETLVGVLEGLGPPSAAPAQE